MDEIFYLCEKLIRLKEYMSEYKCEEVLPYDSGEEKRVQISRMFDRIAGAYDPMNHLMSLGQDYRWRRKAIEKLSEYAPDELLDVATGTGDFAIEAYMRLKPKRLLGVDVSEGMMAVGRRKVDELGIDGKIEFAYQDATAMTLDSESFDAVTVAFGVRNFSSLSKGLAEICRVLRPGGVVAILEMTEPVNSFYKLGYRVYTKLCIPILAKIKSKDLLAYDYLPNSIAAFPQGEEMRSLLMKSGFSSVEIRKFTMQTCTFYFAIK